MIIQGSLLHVKNFKCRSSQAVVQTSPETNVNLDGDTLELVEKFYYLGDVLRTDGKMHDLGVFRIRTRWKVQRPVWYSVWKGAISKNKRYYLYNLCEKYNVLWSSKFGYESQGY